MFFPEPEAEKDGMGRKGSYYWESQLSEYWDGPRLDDSRIQLTERTYKSIRRLRLRNEIRWKLSMGSTGSEKFLNLTLEFSILAR